jgi:hypothetical protein
MPEPQGRAAVICNVDFLRRQPVSILWIIIIGFIAGVIARLLAPGPDNPTGFILTTVLGIVGASREGAARAPSTPALHCRRQELRRPLWRA